MRAGSTVDEKKLQIHLTAGSIMREKKFKMLGCDEAAYKCVVCKLQVFLRGSFDNNENWKWSGALV